MRYYVAESAAQNTTTITTYITQAKALAASAGIAAVTT